MTQPKFGRVALQTFCAAMAVCICLPAVAAEKTSKASAAKTAKGKASANGKAPIQVNFTKHIAPILHKNCATCHHAGAVGPFSLLTYDDAKKRSEHIAEIVTSRRMPPWKAEHDFGKFIDERRLTDREIALINRWAKTGAPEGDPKDMPKLPEFSSDWQLGEPDLVLQMEKPFAVPATGRDIYRCFVIPIPAKTDKMVCAVEFKPGNAKIVHHAIMFLDANGEARKKDGKDGKPGFLTFGGPGIVPTGGLGSWAPGAVPRFLPDGVVKFVKKGSDLVLQVHYHPSGKDETDQSQVGIHFYKKQFKKIVTGIAVNQGKLNIPAGEARHQVTAESQELPVDVTVLAVTPHMHNLGREFKVTATRPEKEGEVPLVWIKDWDFNWQNAYQFIRPISLPKGSKIKVVAVYDNSAENPRNPNSPPKDVHWGDQTKDEMCLCGVQIITEKFSDLRDISKMSGHELAAGLEGGVPGMAEAAKKAAAKREQAKKDAAAKRELAKKDSKAVAEPASTTSKPAAAAGEEPAMVADADTSATNPSAPPAAAPEPTEVAAKPAKPAKSGGRGGPQVPPEGVVIPPQMSPLMAQFDLNKDGKITPDEVDKAQPDAKQALQIMLQNIARQPKPQ